MMFHIAQGISKYLYWYGVGDGYWYILTLPKMGHGMGVSEKIRTTSR